MIKVVVVPFDTIERVRRQEDLLARAVAVNVRLLKSLMRNPIAWAKTCKANPNMIVYAKRYGLI